MDQVLTVLADRGPVLLPVLVVFVGVLVVKSFFDSSSRKLKKIPLLGKELGNSERRRQAFLSGASELYERGYKDFGDKPFRMTTADGDHVVVPRSNLEELRRLPMDHINSRKALGMLIETKYTGLDVENEFLSHIVRSDLTRSLSRVNERLSAEVDRTVNEVLGECEDWTNTRVVDKLLRIIAIVSGHVFLGPDLCRREEYIHASINYTVDVFGGARKLKQWHTLLRPLGQYVVPEVRNIAGHRRKAKAFLLPVIRERKEAAHRGEKTPDDMLQWMINKADRFSVSDEDIAETQLSLSLAAIHTTTMSTTDILTQLVTRPDVIEELREELRQVLEANDNVLTTGALFDLKLMDSVMRETQRVEPFNEARFARYVIKPVTVGDVEIPGGTTLEAAHGPATRDPALYPHPDQFDAHRFADLRTSKVADPIGYKNLEQYQFVSVTKENMGFGFGPNACPGRFFASNEIKLVLARILQKYDVRLPPGKSVPPRLISGSGSQANPDIEFEFKKVNLM